jgi:hypothetical protein
MEGLGVAASVIAVIDLSAKIASLCSQYIKDVKNAEKDVRRLLQGVSSLNTVTGDINKLISGSDSARFKSSQKLKSVVEDGLSELQALETKLEGLERKLRPGGRRYKIIARIGLAALRWPLSSKEVEKAIQEIAYCTQILSLALQHDHL